MKVLGQPVKVKIGTEDEVKEMVSEAGKSYLYYLRLREKEKMCYRRKEKKAERKRS